MWFSLYKPDIRKTNKCVLVSDICNPDYRSNQRRKLAFDCDVFIESERGAAYDRNE